jgi:hypothetical protein
MSGYEYDDDDTDYTPYVIASVGGAGGRLIGRRLAGKVGKKGKAGKKKKGGGKTSRELRADRFSNIGTVSGAGAGYAAGGLATGDETVRGTLDRVLSARDAARDVGEGLASPTGRQVVSDAMRYAAGGAAVAGIPAAYRVVKRNFKSLGKGGKRPKSIAPDLKDLKRGAKFGAASVGLGVTGNLIKPDQQQPYSGYDLLPNPYMESYDPYAGRRR